jgi:hypothetical protein
MQTQEPTVSAEEPGIRSLLQVASRTRLAELGVESDATLEEALGARREWLTIGVGVIAWVDGKSFAEDCISALRGSLNPKAQGVLGALLDHSRTAEALARKLDAKDNVYLRMHRDTPPPEGGRLTAREELLEAVEVVRYWSSVFATEEKSARDIRMAETNRQGAPVEEVALWLEALALSVAPSADPKTVATWANRLALDHLRPDMDPEHFARLKTRARRDFEAGKRPRLRTALFCCEAALALSS